MAFENTIFGGRGGKRLVRKFSHFDKDICTNNQKIFDCMPQSYETESNKNILFGKSLIMFTLMHKGHGPGLKIFPP